MEQIKNQWTFKNDNEYYTPEYFVRPLIKHIKKRFEGKKDIIIWCPFDTKDSAYVKVLSAAGFIVKATHIDTGQDFYTYDPDFNFDIIVSNPPFSGKRKTLERVNSYNKPFMLVFGIQYANSGGFVEEMSRCKNLQMIMFKRRVFYMSYANYQILIETGKIQKPTFHSWYICNDVLLKDIFYEDLEEDKKEKIIEEFKYLNGNK